MAIKDNLQQKIDTARKAGYSDAQIQTFLRSQGINETIKPKEPSYSEKVVNKITGLPEQFAEDVMAGAKDIETGLKTEPQNILGIGSVLSPTVEKGIVKAGLRTAGDVAGALFSPISTAIGMGVEKVGSIAKKYLPKISEPVSGLYTDITEAIANIPEVQEFAIKHPNAEQDFERVLNLIMASQVKGDITKIPEIIKAGGEKTKTVIGEKLGDVSDILSTNIEKAKTALFGKEKTANIEDVINLADKNISAETVKGISESTTALPSIKEKWAGVSPTFKNRFAGKTDFVKDYFSVAKARNNFDTLPTPTEYAVIKAVEPAQVKIEALLNDKGSEIGAFRNKISSYETTIDQVRRIEDSFINGLNKLNLEVKGGNIIKKPGTITKVASDSEIGVLNDLYAELKTFKENPSLEKAIDLRNRFDRKINFEKSARDISNTLDPLSKTVRSQIAKEAADLVGKSEAQKLADYSNLIEALEDLKSFTDRKAGGEFLLRQALSARGRVPREVMDVVKKYTGIDLMDHAVMSTLATDLIGGIEQKGLFRQELTKAGLDTAAALTGDPKGWLNLLNSVGKKALLDEEKTFIEATKIK